MSVIARATFGSYRNRAYTAEGFPVAVDVEPRVAEIRVGWVYRVKYRRHHGTVRPLVAPRRPTAAKDVATARDSAL